MLYIYSLFIAGYFLLPMASGHRRVYYLLVFPAVLLLWRELLRFYRGNLLLGLLLAYAAWMMLSHSCQPAPAAEKSAVQARLSIIQPAYASSKPSSRFPR